MPRTTEITNNQDVIDSRDVIARIEALEESIQDAFDAHEENPDAEVPDEDEVEELARLKKLAAQGEGYGDWDSGETLISESHFPDYARELHADTSETVLDAWPYNCIDWEKAADELKQDYTELDFDGTAYFMRA